MKKLLAILMICLYIFGSTDAYQLLKIPLLVQHYMYHKNANASLSFSDFIQIHYNYSIVVDNDFDKDQQLPFRSQQTNFDQNSNTLIVPKFETTTSLIFNLHGSEYNLFRCIKPAYVEKPEIFQPPKISTHYFLYKC